MDVEQGMARRGDVELWWERFGPPSRRGIVFHPGNGDTADVAPKEFFERLRAGGWTVVRFDPRDTGRSTRISDESLYGLDDLAADVWAVADAAGIESATLIGYSLGGAVVQAAAVAAPGRVDGLVLLATPARPPETIFGEIAMSLMSTLAYDDTPMAFDEASAVFHGATPAAIAAVQQRMTPGRAPTGRSSTRHGAAAMSGPIPTDEKLGELTCPVLVLHSTDDKWVPHEQADASARPFPNAVVQRTSGIGHVPLDHQWLDFADAMTRFLTSTSDLGRVTESAPEAGTTGTGA